MAHTAVISGATGGIGGVVARRLWEEGYSLLCLGYTPGKVVALQHWFSTHPRAGQQAEVRCVDVRQERQVTHLHLTLERMHAPVTLLVVCHGAAPQPVVAHRATVAAVQTWQCDILGTLYVCQLVYPTMQAQHQGTMVLVSSAHALATYPQRVPYALAKAGVCALARALAVEWGADGITVNALAPWQVEGERSTAVAAREHAESGIDTLELYRQRSPLRQLVPPEDVAETVLWLVRTPRMTGQTICLDAGVGVNMWHRPFLE